MLYTRRSVCPLLNIISLIPILCIGLTIGHLATAEEDSSKTISVSQLAETPPMGWNSWNTFGPDISADVVRGVADKIVELGLKDLGYQYVVIDDHWQGGRDAKGHLLANCKRRLKSAAGSCV